MGGREGRGTALSNVMFDVSPDRRLTAVNPTRRRTHMKTDHTDEENTKPEQQTSAARGGATSEDRSKDADSTDQPEGIRSRGGVAGDDRSKDFGGPEDNPKA
jgi:hypothetical protein